MRPQATLPLFPLPLTVLPGEVTALHVFEPRYRDMIDHCLAKPNPEGDFVIVCQNGAQSPDLGAAVCVVRVMNTHPDGTRDILVEGKRAVRTVTRFQLHSYDSARVEDLSDPGEDWDEELATRVYALHRQLLLACTGDEPSDAFYQRRESLAFVVAACSGFTPGEKQHLLALGSENDRLAYVRGKLETVLPFLQRAVPMWKEIVGAYSMAGLAREDPEIT